MGIPYSREIRSAFDQVTPLVEAGFKALETTKNISIFLAILEVLTFLSLLSLNLFLLLLLISVNPDLEEERKALVTPWLKMAARWMTMCSEMSVLGWCVGFGVGLAGAGLWVGYRNRARLGEGYVRMLYGVGDVSELDRALGPLRVDEMVRDAKGGVDGEEI